MALNYGLNYGPMGGVGDLSFQIGNALGGGSGGNGVAGCGSILSAAGLDQWRVPLQTQQFPFFAGLEGSHGNLYPFESSGEVSGYGDGVSHLRPKVSTSGLITQLASVKMEDSSRELNLSGQFLGSNNNIPSSGQQYWNTGTTTSAWTDLSGFSSSSTTSNQL